MNINWFPGHMAKSLRVMQKEVANIDVIIYVLDARAPLSSLNPEFVKIIGEKPILYVLNKSDLADDKKTEHFLPKLENYNSKVIKFNAAKSQSGKIIENLIKDLAKSKIERFKNKGINIYPSAMVIGITNAGKSTLINNLCGSSRTLTGNKPGVTRGKQVVTLKSGIRLLDTPGTLWPSFEDENVAINLALIGSIKDDVLDMSGLCRNFVKFIVKNYPKMLISRYGIEVENKEINEIIYEIGKKRGILLKGGEVDFEKTSILIINEFRKGSLGKITLDLP